jgi:hypothetical protein
MLQENKTEDSEFINRSKIQMYGAEQQIFSSIFILGKLCKMVYNFKK